MSTQITNYQCPACTAPLKFSPESGKLECEYCQSSYDVAEIEALYAKKLDSAAAAMDNQTATQPDEAAGQSWDYSGLSGDWGADGANMRSYSCPSCAAELMCDANTAATSCPYCGNPTVVPGQFSGALKPDYVIPFSLTKEDAVAAVKQHYKGKLLLPGTFSSTNTIDQIQGVYVPFWMYDGLAEGDFHFHGTTVRSYTRGDKEITETGHYDVARQGSMSFEKVPVDGSSKMPDTHMEGIEPFDYSQLRPFSTAYMPGFLADKYDISAQENSARADERCANSLEDAVRSTLVGYSSVDLLDKNVQLHRGKVHYAMLPVWLLNVKWNNKIYLFAVNGQTGKTAGEMPVSKGRALALFASVAAPLSALAVLIARLIVG